MANIVWITGLSGAGKTTLGKLLVRELSKQGESVILMDGDELRSALGETTNYSASARLDLAKKYSRLALLVASQGVTVVVCTVALIREIHLWNRANLPGYFEVFLKVPIEELRRRDPKGIYRRFDNGELSNVAGLDLKIDEPAQPDLYLEYKEGMSPEVGLERLLEALAMDRIRFSD